MAHLRSAKELWSETESGIPVLIMGNSPSVNLHEDDVYDRFYTIGCNSRLHTRYVPDLTMMVDRNIPTPPLDCEIATHLDHWQQSHPGTVYTYRLGRRLQFHPDPSDAVIDYSITSAYMAICVAYMMGYRTIHLVGIDLGSVDGKDYHDTAIAVSESRRLFFNACYNHLSYLIGKMSRYHGVRFISLSPYTQLLQNGWVKQYAPV